MPPVGRCVPTETREKHDRRLSQLAVAPHPLFTI
jgi:hypothetical protein